MISIKVERAVKGDAVPKKPKPDAKPDPLAELERAQEQLRDNIEESKHLVEKTQELLRKAKDKRPG